MNDNVPRRSPQRRLEGVVTILGSGVLVWALPPLALVIAGPLALAAESTREG